MGLFQTQLAACRANFGSPPRRFSPWSARYLWPRPPVWLLLNPQDELWQLYRHRRQLLRGGRIVWGALIQANVQLFSPGSVDCPAAVAYSLDPAYEDAPETLARVGQALFSLKETVPDDPALRKLASDITDERIRTMKLLVPETITEGREVFYTVILVHRSHLPHRCLAAGIFPLLVMPEVTEATMILPSRYWTEGMRAHWRAGSR
jgi:hypothetical protein